MSSMAFLLLQTFVISFPLSPFSNTSHLPSLSSFHSPSSVLPCLPPSSDISHQFSSFSLLQHFSFTFFVLLPFSLFCPSLPSSFFRHLSSVFLFLPLLQHFSFTFFVLLPFSLFFFPLPSSFFRLLSPFFLFLPSPTFLFYLLCPPSILPLPVLFSLAFLLLQTFVTIFPLSPFSNISHLPSLSSFHSPSPCSFFPCLPPSSDICHHFSSFPLLQKFSSTVFVLLPLSFSLFCPPLASSIFRLLPWLPPSSDFCHHFSFFPLLQQFSSTVFVLFPLSFSLVCPPLHFSFFRHLSPFFFFLPSPTVFLYRPCPPSTLLLPNLSSLAFLLLQTFATIFPCSPFYNSSPLPSLSTFHSPSS